MPRARPGHGVCFHGPTEVSSGRLRQLLWRPRHAACGFAHGKTTSLPSAFYMGHIAALHPAHPGRLSNARVCAHADTQVARLRDHQAARGLMSLARRIKPAAKNRGEQHRPEETAAAPAGARRREKTRRLEACARNADRTLAQTRPGPGQRPDEESSSSPGGSDQDASGDRPASTRCCHIARASSASQCRRPAHARPTGGGRQVTVYEKRNVATISDFRAGMTHRSSRNASWR